MNLAVRPLGGGLYAVRTGLATYELQVSDDDLIVTAPGLFLVEPLSSFPPSFHQLACGLSLIINLELEIQGE